jgi:hypothetical protein
MMLKIRNLLVSATLSFILASCSNPISSEFFDGDWVIEPDSCEGGEVYRFRSDGTWSSDGMAGNWSFKDSDLIMGMDEASDNQGLAEAAPSEWVIKIASHDADHFTQAGDPGASDVKWKRCNQPDTDVLSKSDEEVAVQSDEGGSERGLFAPAEQKIIWEWTGGLIREGNAYETTIVEQCKKMNEPLNEYATQGWRIVSSVPNTRVVNSGKCEGRDIIIEK